VALRIELTPHGTDSVCSIRIAERGTTLRHLRANFHISDNLRNLRRARYLILAVWLAA
jgi:hypothetical protein